MKKVPVVFLSADPTHTLHLDADLRNIKNKVRAAKYRDALDFNPCLAARLDDLVQALHETKPQIVHFSGHANHEGLMLVGADEDTPHWVSERDLEELFAAFRDNIRVVVLSGCFTCSQAKAIAKIVGCAVGTPAKILDEAAIVFNAEFYRAIAFGESLKGAYEKGLAVLTGNLDAVRPVLEVGLDVDPGKVFLVKKPAPALTRWVAVAALLIVSSGVTFAAAHVGGEHGASPLRSRRLATVDTGTATTSPAEDLTVARELHRVGNYAASFPRFRRAAEAGIPEAMGFLGVAYLRGEGTERNPDLTAHWLSLAARARDAQGMNAYGLAYEDGFGVGQSYQWARHWYEVAAMEKNDAEAMRNLARLYRQGLGTAPRDSLALAWYLKAVDAGSVDAIVDVGLMYAEGVRGRRDADEALRWFQRATDAGSPRAMLAIGHLHEDAKNYGQALVWYRRAADAGSAEAMNNLGMLYQNGWGVASDRAEAARWYSRAAEAGSHVAAGNLTALEGK
jgi:TPR repeat protein